MRTLVGVNTLTSVDQVVYLSHCNFWTKTVKQYPDDEFVFYAPYRMSVDNMRNAAVDAALEYKCDYLLFIDDDVVIEPHTFKSLFECNLDVVMALTYIRGYPFEPMFFAFKDGAKQQLALYGDFKNDIKENGIVYCDAVGNSCTLYKTWMFKEIPKPWFVTIPNRCTEDVYFHLLMLEHLKTPVKVGVDTKVPTAHKIAPEYISMGNRDALMAFTEAVYPVVKHDKGSNNKSSSEKSE
jgi:glycosyltransferase involved in cell wall biosynthesis